MASLPDTRASSNMPGPSDGAAHSLSAFVSFPSPYTQSLLLSALVSVLPSISISLVPPEEDDPPQLQWADYDLMSFDVPHANPSKYLLSSYIYRKALIRKHQLHLTVTSYLAKCRHRGTKSVLDPQWQEGGGGIPRGWVAELQFADELDELLGDELWEVGEGMRANAEKDEQERTWYILKPGFADRAQGIRLFSTEDELRAIFEKFEPLSSDEGEDEDDEDEDDEDGARVSIGDAVDALAKKAVEMGFGEDGEGDEEGDDEGGTGVMTSQLRHFVIQEYIPRPILFDISQTANDANHVFSGHKFHLRAYVLLTGGYTVHLSRTVLALFSSSPYAPPTSHNTEESLLPHLTNTCLQTDAYGAPKPDADLVKTLWELEGLDLLRHTSEGGCESVGRVSKEWLERAFAKAGEVVAESVKAGAECGSFGLQLIPNAFEIFGVDLLLSFPAASSSVGLPEPIVTLLEFNASPDYHQSGDRLRPQLLEMFRGVIRLSVAPFFGLATNGEGAEAEGAAEGGWKAEMALGEERWGWRLVGRGEVRSFG